MACKHPKKEVLTLMLPPSPLDYSILWCTECGATKFQRPENNQRNYPSHVFRWKSPKLARRENKRCPF